MAPTNNSSQLVKWTNYRQFNLNFFFLRRFEKKLTKTHEIVFIMVPKGHPNASLLPHEFVLLLIQHYNWASLC